MINPNTKQRELAFVVKVDKILPIDGADRVEQAVVGGWRVMVRKCQFQPGDLAIYFEIDSKVPEKEPFMFLESKHYKIKTQRYFKGAVISQGLLMSPEDFGWTSYVDEDGIAYIYNNEKNISMPEGYFLTEELGVKYSVEEDNIRKAPSIDKYKKMAARHPQMFQNPFIKKIYKTEWGKKFLFVFFGKKKDTRSAWPAWVQKTDEERVQNMTWILEDKEPWIATEKIDGTSTTFTMKRGKKKFFGKTENEFYVCSRNVVFDKPDKSCYYDTNVYMEMAEKYHVEEVLTQILNNRPDLEWVTLQGETYGAGIQKRDYSLEGHDFMGFNFITSATGRWGSCEAGKLMNAFNIPWVPIVDENFILPDTVEELLDIATGKSVVDGDMREGLVFRSKDGSKSFKAVSNEFLLKYHS